MTDAAKPSGVVAVARNVFVTVSAATAMASPWMLGSESVTAQRLLFWGAVVTAIVGSMVRLVAPFRASEKRRDQILFAALIVGAVLLVELAVQVANPSHAFIPEGTLWRLVPLSPEPSLPQAIGGRFDQGDDYIPFKNAARYLLIFGAVWCYAMGLALGLVERIDARKWAAWVGINGVVMSVVCLAHRVMREELTLWKFQTTFDFTHSPIFFYKNHNGAYLAASLAVVLGLAASQRIRIRRNLWEMGAGSLWLATVAVNSRAATAIATIWVALYLGIRIRRASVDWRATRGSSMRNWGRLIRSVVVALLVLAAGGFLLVKAQAVSAIVRFSGLWSSPIDFLQGGKMRALQRELGLEIWRDRPVWGWGGGSFVYLFNTYHVRVPELAEQVYRDQPQLNRFYGPTVNCDWIEFLVEYGILGVAFMLGAVGVVLIAWLRWRGWADMLSLFLLGGVLGLFMHAYLDYILRNPAILFLGAGAFVAAFRLIPPAVEQ